MTRRRRWLLLVLGALIAARLLLGLLLPSLLFGPLRDRGLLVEHEDIDLSLLGGELVLRNVDVRAAASEEPFAHLEYAVVDVDVSSCLTGTLRVHRVEVDGLDLALERLPEDLTPAHASERDEEPEPPGPLDLGSPAAIDAVRLQDVQLTWGPGRRLDLDLRVSDLGFDERVARVDLRARCAGALDLLRVQGTVVAHEDSAGTHLQLEVDGLRPAALEDLLAGAGLGAGAEEVELDLILDARLERRAERPTEATLSLEIHELLATADEERVAALQLLSVAGELAPGALVLGDVQLDGLDVLVQSAPSGALRLAGLEVGGGADEPAPPDESEFTFIVEELGARGSALTWRDLAFEPPAELRLELPDLQVEGLGRDALTVELEAVVPGAVGSLGLSARAELLGPALAVEASLRGSGITLAAAAPWLAGAGWQPDLEQGELAAALRAELRRDAAGALSGDVSLTGLALRDGEAEHFGCDLVGLTRLSLAADGQRVGLEQLEVQGLRLPLARDERGALRVLGLRACAPRPPASAVTVEAPAVPVGTPRLDVARIRLAESRITWTDASQSAPVPLLSADVGLEVTGLGLGGDPARDPTSTATLRVTVVAPPLLEQLELAGTLRSAPGPLDLAASFDLTGTGLGTDPLQPYLEAAGAQSTLRDARLRLALQASLRQDGEALVADAALTDLELAVGEGPVAALEELKLEGLRLAPGGTRLEALTLERPRLVASRDGEGGLHLFGLRFPPAVAAPAADPREDETSPSAWWLGRASVVQAGVAWRDAFVDPEAAVELTLDGSAEDLTSAAGASPGHFELRASVPPSLESLVLAGTAQLAPEETRVAARLDLRGLDAGPLAGYLPPGVRAEITDGRLGLGLSFSDVGGALRAELADLVWRDGEGAPLLELPSLVVDVPQRGEGLVEVRRVAVSGLALDARADADGALHLLGLALTPAEGQAPAVEQARPVPLGPRRITLGELDLELARFGYSAEGAEPLALSLRLTTPGPQVLLDESPGELPPLQLALRGAAAPFARELQADLALQPWARPALLQADLAASGLSWGDLVDGEAGGRLVAELTLDRRAPTEVDLSRPFGLRLALTDLSLLDAPGGEVLVGLDALHVEAPRVDLAGASRVAQVELLRPRARLLRDSAGLHVAGLVLGGGPVAEASEPETAPAASPQIDVGLIAVRGLDAEFRDSTVEPEARLPLDDLEIEVRGFSTRVTAESPPLTFNVAVGAGEVELPRRVSSSSVLAGVASAAAVALAGGEEQVDTELRPVFEDLAASGRFTLAPVLDGHAQLSLAAFELLSAAGLCSSAGVVIGDGLLDLAVRLRFRGGDQVAVDSTVTLGELSVSEPAGGLVETYLRLPAPLDTVVFLLQDQGGELRIPLSFTADAEGVGSGSIAAAAATALASVLATAVASAPLRMAGTLTDLVGVTGGEEEGVVTVALACGPGDVALPADAAALLAEVIDELDDDDVVLVVEPRFSAGDLERLAVLANPSPEDCRQVAAQIEQRKAELLRRRAEQAAAARALYAVDRDAATEASAALRELDVELSRAEAGLDQVYDLLRPGAEGRAAQRVRAAGRLLAEGRVASLRTLLREAGIEEVEQRLAVRGAQVEADQGPGGLLVTPRER